LRYIAWLTTFACTPIFDLLQKISNQFHEATAKSPGFNAKAQSRQDA
jgi:hypothetical protein